MQLHMRKQCIFGLHSPVGVRRKGALQLHEVPSARGFRWVAPLLHLASVTRHARQIRAKSAVTTLPCDRGRSFPQPAQTSLLQLNLESGNHGWLAI